jgi:hypothetical protein
MQSLSQDHSPMPLAQKAGPILPRADAPEILFGGFVFTAGDPPPSAGLFALTRRIRDFLYPVLIVEAENMAAAVEKLHADEPVLAAGLADGLCWMARDNARSRLKPAAAQTAISKVEHMSVCFQAGLFPPKTPAREHES